MSLCGVHSGGEARSSFGKRATVGAFETRLAGSSAGPALIPEFLIYFNYLSPRVAASQGAAVRAAATSPGTRPPAARGVIRRSRGASLKNLLDSASPSDLRLGRIWKILLEEDFRCGSEDHGFGWCVSP